jgi:hypothetical protein
MSKFTAADLIPRLVGEFGYSSYEAEAAVNELAAADLRIQEAFLRWWNTGEVSDLTIEQYNLHRLADEHGLNPVAGFLMLDWLLKEPEMAQAALAHGFDWVE